MAFRASLRNVARLGACRSAACTLAAPAPQPALGFRVASRLSPPAGAPWLPQQTRAVVTALHARAAKETTAQASTMPSGAAAPAVVPQGVRTMTTWRLRPYAAACTSALVPLSSLSAGYSKVSLSLLVMPWKALPMALAVAPMAWLFPAAYRMIFQNSMRHTTASAFSALMYLTLAFLPVPCFENLFSDMAFYILTLCTTFFMYTFFPEVLLHDFMFMHYLALFTIPVIPLAFAYMPMFAARSYLFL
mmetsp:Transcript_101970/g.288748  ORF Transcript_101970/g.288748 Transcript_101970/m.288748 type:complete len:247 (-) Transcript_101970:178-918(-)